VTRLALYAWTVLAYNLGVILWGAYVRATGSGAGCGSHWPLCDGQLVPTTPSVAMLIEYSHRVTSGLALISVVVLLWWTRRERPAGHAARRAAGWTVDFMLLEAAVACGSRPRFVYLSALGADRRPVNAYMAVRTRVEAAVEGSALPYLIARPGFISGDDRYEPRTAERVAARIGDGLLGGLARLGATRLHDRYASLTGSQLGAALVELVDTSTDEAVIAEPETLRAHAIVRASPR